MIRKRINRIRQIDQLDARIAPTTTPHNLAVTNFQQNWNATSLITANDDWSVVPSVTGYLGDLAIGEGVDPQTIVTPFSVVNVIANQGANTGLAAGGVAEFDGLMNPTIALQADATADAPNMVVSIYTLGRTDILLSYNIRDLDDTSDDAVQPVALQYRIGDSGNFINVPSAFVADATIGPNLTKVTPVSVQLPGAVANQSEVQIRFITANAVGNDEWVGVDDIVVSCSELRLNTSITLNQFFFGRAVAVDDDGDGLVVWQGSTESVYDVFAQRFNAAGQKVGSEFLVNTYTTKGQFSPSVAVDADGDALVAWTSTDQDESVLGVFGQRFDAAGNKVGPEFQINTYTTSNQRFPSVALDADGDAVIVWHSAGQDGAGDGIYGQRFSSSGGKVGGEFQINTETNGTQSAPSVSIDGDGDFMVVWHSYGQDPGGSTGVYGQRFDSAGNKVGGEFRINAPTEFEQNFPSVALDADGDAIVVWQSLFQDGNQFGIFGQRFDSAGNKVGGEFPINSYTTQEQRFPSVAVDANGDALVVWESQDQDGSNLGVFGQRFNSAGAKINGEFQVNSTIFGVQRAPAAAMDADGDAVVIWRGEDSSQYGVYSQRFAAPPTQVVHILVNDGAIQRSMVTSIKITFDSPVGFVGSPAAAFSLVNQSNGKAATLSAVIDGSGTAVTLTFTGGSLADGRHNMTVLANQFAGNRFDGDANGIPDDNLIIVGTPANGLFRLFGDADGNGSITATDFNAFRLAYGQIGPSIFDFSGDNQVTAQDFNEFRLRYGTMV